MALSKAEYAKRLRNDSYRAWCLHLQQALLYHRDPLVDGVILPSKLYHNTSKSRGAINRLLNAGVIQRYSDNYTIRVKDFGESKQVTPVPPWYNNKINVITAGIAHCYYRKHPGSGSWTLHAYNHPEEYYWDEDPKLGKLYYPKALETERINRWVKQAVHWLIKTGINTDLIHPDTFIDRDLPHNAPIWAFKFSGIKETVAMHIVDEQALLLRDLSLLWLRDKGETIRQALTANNQEV